MANLIFTPRIIRTTANAMLIEADMIEPDPVGAGFVEFTREAWLPKSQIEDLGDGRLSIPGWLAKDRALEFNGRPGSRFIVMQRAI